MAAPGAGRYGGAATTSTTFVDGGILNRGVLLLSACRVEDNRANAGGGIYNGGILVIDGCTVSGNQARDLGFTNADGAGLLSTNGSTLEVRNTTLVGNASFSSGGVIHAENAATTILENSTLSGNTGFNTFLAQNVGNASNPDCLPEDQRGELRPDGTGDPGDCDIGAVEVVPEPGAWAVVLSALGATVSRARRRRP